MPPSSISSQAFSKLKDLATWLYKTAEMEEEEKNTFRCVDKDRHEKLRPLLEELGYRQIKVTRTHYTCWNIAKWLTGPWVYNVPHIGESGN